VEGRSSDTRQIQNQSKKKKKNCGSKRGSNLYFFSLGNGGDPVVKNWVERNSQKTGRVYQKRTLSVNEGKGGGEHWGRRGESRGRIGGGEGRGGEGDERGWWILGGRRKGEGSAVDRVVREEGRGGVKQGRGDEEEERVFGSGGGDRGCADGGGQESGGVGRRKGRAKYRGGDGAGGVGVELSVVKRNFRIGVSGRAGWRGVEREAGRGGRGLRGSREGGGEWGAG